MQPDSLRYALDWLTRADRDLLGAEKAVTGRPFLADQAAFHAQQAVEKGLKAFLTAHDSPFPRTRNLERLVEGCRAIDPEFARFATAARTLSPYATQFRYPGGLLEPSLQDAYEAIRLAGEIVHFVRGRLFPSGS